VPVPTINHGRKLAVAGAIAAAVATAGCSSTATSPSPKLAASSNTATLAPGILATSVAGAETLDRLVAPPDWKISLWAVGGAKYSNPDSIEIDGQNIWVGYQNASVKDGSNNAITSTIIEYTLQGKVVNTWSVPGHNDGLRVDPSTHKVWITSNEDAAPVLEIIDPTNPTPQAITATTTSPSSAAPSTSPAPTPTSTPTATTCSPPSTSSPSLARQQRSPPC